MKAISLWQPWASLWVVGRKTFETRHWATHYRGPIAIHAAKKLCVDLEPELIEILVDEFGGHWAQELPRGALLGYGRLANCHSTNNVSRSSMNHAQPGVLLITDEENAQGNFEPGRYAWELADRVALARPVPWIGHQGLFDVAEHALGLATPPARENELF